MCADLYFQPKSRLLLQLGDQLIKSSSIAMLELLKNSYDASATKVIVTMKDIDIPERGEIIIEDNGTGMSRSIITDVWMIPGSENKHNIVEKIRQDIKEGKNLPFRIPMGEKGIGRFGVHKLGYQIEIISKMSGKKEISLKINWKDFEKDQPLDKAFAHMELHDKPQVFTDGKTGTRIIINRLRENWTRRNIRELYRAINSLNSPFDEIDSFKVYFKIDKLDWLKGLTSFEEIKSYALYYADIKMSGNQINELHYEFKPWDTMKSLSPRKIDKNNVEMKIPRRNAETREKEDYIINLSKYNIGDVKIKLLIFDRDPNVLKLGALDKPGFKEYLDNNGGIRVFRDGIRIYDYGEPDNDWLGLDEKRFLQPGLNFSNNLVIGAVYLDRLTSTDLIEKTNREGFIENDASREFRESISFALEKILQFRNEDKLRVREFYGSGSIKEPVTGNIKILKNKIAEKIDDKKLKNDLLRIISSIQNDYQIISDIYLRSSSTGLSLSIVIHEIEKIISELVIAVDNLTTDQHIVDLVKILHKTVSDYAGIIKQSKKTKENLGEIITQSLSNIQYRLKAHKIDIVPAYKFKDINTTVKCNPGLVMSTIINIIDNSIWWQHYTNVKNKKILIDITEEIPNHISIIIADNGPGFSISPEDAVKPFITRKPGGMGLGLHLAHEVMNSQGGELIFPSHNEFDVTDDFKDGATLILAFKVL